MEITNISFGFSPFGVHSPAMKRNKEFYMLYAMLTITGRKSRKKVFIQTDPGMLESKQAFQGAQFIDGHMILSIDATYQVFDFEGNTLATVSKATAGTIIDASTASHDSFIGYKDGVFTFYSFDGKVQDSRPASEEEKKALNL